NRGAPRDEIPNRKLTCLAGSDDENAAVAQIPEHLLREGGRSRRNGRRALADRGLCARLPSCLHRLPEKAVEQRSRRTTVVRRAHLAEDLSFARNHRVEPGGDAEEVECGRITAEPVERGAEVRLEGEQRGLGFLLGCVG